MPTTREKASAGSGERVAQPRAVFLHRATAGTEETEPTGDRASVAAESSIEADREVGPATVPAPKAFFHHSAASAEDRARENNSAPAEEPGAGTGVASTRAVLSANSPALQAMTAYVAASSGPFVLNTRMLQEINADLAENLDLARMFARASSDLLLLQGEQFATAMRQATAWRALTRQALTHAFGPTIGVWPDA
jgi:hypothetical protein